MLVVTPRNNPVMNNTVIFGVGLGVSLIAGMGVLVSQAWMWSWRQRWENKESSYSGEESDAVEAGDSK